MTRINEFRSYDCPQRNTYLQVIGHLLGVDGLTKGPRKLLFFHALEQRDQFRLELDRGLFGGHLAGRLWQQISQGPTRFLDAGNAQGAGGRRVGAGCGGGGLW